MTEDTKVKVLDFDETETELSKSLTLKEFISVLHSIIEDHPEALKLPVIFSKDDKAYPRPYIVKYRPRGVVFNDDGTVSLFTEETPRGILIN